MPDVQQEFARFAGLPATGPFVIDVPDALSTRPHTLACGLVDSRVGLAAWPLEKWWSWTLQPGQDWDWTGLDWTGPLTRTLLDTFTLYWVTGSVSGANRAYYHADIEGTPIRTTDRITHPVGALL